MKRCWMLLLFAYLKYLMGLRNNRIKECIEHDKVFCCKKLEEIGKLKVWENKSYGSFWCQLSEQEKGVF